MIVSNTTATGEPTITGTIRVGETLTANTTDLSDSDGLNNATFTYQWLADDADITDGRLDLRPGCRRRGKDHQGAGHLH